MTFYKLPKNLNTQITEYEKLVKGYLQGTVPKTKLKSIRVPFGVYEQRLDETYMMRIRLPGGAITPRQLTAIATIASKYTNRPLHFTTRQDVQIHNLALKHTITLMRELQSIGLCSRGGGGNTIRNILGNYDSGIDRQEVFDVSPYIQALTSQLISEADSWTLPRKLKIAFSSSTLDKGLATINDLGFIAHINKNGEKGFSVYLAGGMGRKSKVGFLLYDFIPDCEVYNIAKTTKNFFDKYGNRKNKHKARLRFVLEKMGKKKFIETFEQEYQKVKEKNILPLNYQQPK